MNNKIVFIRWLLLIPSAFAGWYLALFVGIILYGVADTFCPKEMISSNVCEAPWHEPVINGVIIFGASLSAILVIIFSVLMAPTKKLIIAYVSYTAGFITAVLFALSTSAWGAFTGAVVTGLITVVVLKRYLTGKISA